MKKLEIFNEVKGWKVPKKKLFLAFDTFLRQEKWVGMEVVVIFVGEAKMRELNWRWRGRKGSTDVLSFNYGSAPTGACGEIYICVKVAERYTLKAGESLQSEILALFVHGLLHLAGYTHENEQKFGKMMGRASEILGKI